MIAAFFFFKKERTKEGGRRVTNRDRDADRGWESGKNMFLSQIREFWLDVILTHNFSLRKTVKCHSISSFLPEHIPSWDGSLSRVAHPSPGMLSQLCSQDDATWCPTFQQRPGEMRRRSLLLTGHLGGSGGSKTSALTSASYWLELSHWAWGGSVWPFRWQGSPHMSVCPRTCTEVKGL